MPRVQVKCGFKDKPAVFWSKKLNEAAHESLRKKGRLIMSRKRPRVKKEHKDT